MFAMWLLRVSVAGTEVSAPVAIAAAKKKDAILLRSSAKRNRTGIRGEAERDTLAVNLLETTIHMRPLKSLVALAATHYCRRDDLADTERIYPLDHNEAKCIVTPDVYISTLPARASLTSALHTTHTRNTPPVR